MTTVRVEKRKWDRTIAAVDTAYPLAVPGDSAAWFVLAGSRRERPRKGTIEILDSDELWVAVPGEWWVLCGHTDAARSLNGYQVHAAAPFEAPRGGDEIVWVDLDLDFDVRRVSSPRRSCCATGRASVRRIARQLPSRIQADSAALREERQWSGDVGSARSASIQHWATGAELVASIRLRVRASAGVVSPHPLTEEARMFPRVGPPGEGAQR